MLKFNVITIFPKILDSYINETILDRAIKNKLIKVNMLDLRKFSDNKWGRVDDTPYGGGAGMVMRVDVWHRAVNQLYNKSIKQQIKKTTNQPINKTIKQKCKDAKMRKHEVVLLTPAGKQFDQRMAERYSKLDEITFVCGRYEGIDARVEKFVDEKISVGPYVLAGGELAAALIIEAVSRLVPGALGNQESLSEETFGNTKSQKHTNHKNTQITKTQDGYKEYPQYTRPEVFEYRDEKGKIRRLRVPKVLLSGDHGKIREWREERTE